MFSSSMKMWQIILLVTQFEFECTTWKYQVWIIARSVDASLLRGRTKQRPWHDLVNSDRTLVSGNVQFCNLEVIRCGFFRQLVVLYHRAVSILLEVFGLHLKGARGRLDNCAFLQAKIKCLKVVTL